MYNSLTCNFCNKRCKNSNSHRNHERLCKENPNRQFTWFSSNNPEVIAKRRTGKKSNGAIKAKELGVPFFVSEATRKKISINSKSISKEKKLEHSKQVSKTIKEKVLRGEWHNSISRKKQIEYKGIRFDSSWEVAYAKYLDSQNTKWTRCIESFPYNYENKDRRYFPDFYLIELNEYVEIKGLQRARDVAKWDQFPKDKKLVVLKEKELKKLGII